MFSTSRVVQGITNRFATSYLVVVHLRNKLCGLWVLGNMGFSLVCPSIVMTGHQSTGHFNNGRLILAHYYQPWSQNGAFIRHCQRLLIQIEWQLYTVTVVGVVGSDKAVGWSLS